jgi:hypothetical protein
MGGDRGEDGRVEGAGRTPAASLSGQSGSAAALATKMKCASPPVIRASAVAVFSSLPLAMTAIPE